MQLSLTGVTTVYGIAAVLRIGEFSGGHFAMANAQPSRLLTGFHQQVRSQSRRNTSDRSGGSAKLLMGNGRHKRAVHSAGIGHTHAPIPGNGLA